MAKIDQYPDSMGVPPTLYPERMKGESFEGYKERRRKGNKDIKDYVQSSVGDHQRASVRILKRLRAGKRSYFALNSTEVHHIQRVIPFVRHKEKHREWRKRLIKFLEAFKVSEIGTETFWKELREENETALSQ